MHLLRNALFLFFPVLLHGGFLNIQISTKCGTTTLTASSGSLICSGPDDGMAQAVGLFDDIGGAVVASALGTFDRFLFFSATALLEAAYQITLFGAQGPGYLEVSPCVTHDSFGFASASLISSEGSVFWSPAFSSCSPPNDLPIVFGVPLDLQLSLQARGGPVSCCGRGAEGGASASPFYRVLDARRNPVSWTAEVIVPEPRTWQLWIVGDFLLGLAWCCRRAKRKLRSGPTPVQRGTAAG